MSSEGVCAEVYLYNIVTMKVNVGTSGVLVCVGCLNRYIDTATLIYVIHCLQTFNR